MASSENTSPFFRKSRAASSISKASRKLGQGRESEPGVEEIAAELDMSAQEILDTMLSARTVRSLDESFEEDDERSLLNILADNNQETPDSDVITSSVSTAPKP